MNEALWKDLSLVLPSRREEGEAKTSAFMRGKPCAIAEAMRRCAELFAASKQPAITGMNMLTMEAARAAVTLAMRRNARLLPEAREHSLEVAQLATLGHVFACDYVIKPGPARWAADHPVAAAVALRVLHSMFVPPGLNGVLALRENVLRRGAAAIAGSVPQEINRVAVLLPPGTQIEVISQWHKLAASVQGELRMCVMVLPDMATYGNGRGALEVITWRTGFAGAVEFREGQARKCVSGLAGVDLAIEAGATQPSDIRPRIVIGHEPDRKAEACFVTPGLALGLAAHVCRFDGQILRLYEDFSTAPPDPTVALLEQMTKA